MNYCRVREVCSRNVCFYVHTLKIGRLKKSRCGFFRSNVNDKSSIASKLMLNWNFTCCSGDSTLESDGVCCSEVSTASVLNVDGHRDVPTVCSHSETSFSLRTAVRCAGTSRGKLRDELLPVWASFVSWLDETVIPWIIACDVIVGANSLFRSRGGTVPSKGLRVNENL